MASLVENLIQVLDKESQEYQSLLELSSKKTPVIISGDLEELLKITDEEQNVADRINHLDRKRQEVIKDIANVMNKDVENLKLAEVIRLLEGRRGEQSELSRIYDKLQRVVQSVKRVNDQNRGLLNSALEMVEFDINILQAAKAAPETANYNRGAYNAGTAMGTDFNGFDAKQ